MSTADLSPIVLSKLRILQDKLGTEDLETALDKSLNIANYVADTISDPTKKLLVERGVNIRNSMESPDGFVLESIQSESLDIEGLRSRACARSDSGRGNHHRFDSFFIIIGAYLYEAGKATDATWPRIKDVMQSILPAVTTVLGTALGFYFGSQKR